MFVFLIRKVKGRLRLYNLSLQRNLFNEYLVTKTYGAIRNKKASRELSEYFNEERNAKNHFNEILNLKLKKGYEIMT